VGLFVPALSLPASIRLSCIPPLRHRVYHMTGLHNINLMFFYVPRLVQKSYNQL
jgi:hypothetical protein